MTRHEQVVDAFARVGVTHQATTGSYPGKILVSTRHKFVRVDLMPGVPNQTIMSEIEFAVQSQTKLDHAQVRREVRRACC